MSLCSMTGFGRGAVQRKGVRAEVEISSVNRRQLDVQIHLPRELQVLESRIQTEIARCVTRGRVAVSVAVRTVEGARPAVRLCEPLARAYVAAFRRLGRRLKLADGISLRTLTSIPDLWEVERPEREADRVWPPLRAALRQALHHLVAMRRTEGRALGADLRARLDGLRRRLNRLRREAPAAARRRRECLLRRLNDLTACGVGSREDLMRELVVAVERMDIAEELTRLSSHVDQARRTLCAAGACGRSLDFLAQEMMREANTIAAKSPDGPLTSEIVEFKAELERIREQIQNIE